LKLIKNSVRSGVLPLAYQTLFHHAAFLIALLF
jgi:hypothetical protein